jgi:hypothetical protein
LLAFVVQSKGIPVILKKDVNLEEEHLNKKGNGRPMPPLYDLT